MQEAHEENVNVVDYRFNSNKIKGLYCDGTIALNSSMKTTSERTCVLAEELGHHNTSSGNIIDLKDSNSVKQECIARAWGYEKLVGLRGIIDAYNHRCTTLESIAEYLNVTEKYKLDEITYYENKYGLFAKVDNYVLYLEPTVIVLEWR